jgi:hypothetical protein
MLDRKEVCFHNGLEYENWKSKQNSKNESWCLMNGVIEDTIYTILMELLVGELIQNARNG